MNSKEATQLVRMQQWSQIIHDRMESGLSVSKYCAEHGLSRNAYFYWLKKIRNNTLQAIEPVFTDISGQLKAVVQDTGSFISETVPSINVLIRFRDAEIRIYEDIPEDLLMKLCRVMRNA